MRIGWQWAVARIALAGITAATGIAGLAAARNAASPPAASPVLPTIISTRDATEIRLAFSPDGKRRLWGRIDRDGTRGFDIYESILTATGWSPAKPVSFNSAANEFDPFFAADGRSVLFFSNRPGGLGGDDLWSVSVDPRTGAYGTPVNLGAPINTPGNEWAPGLSPDGRHLLFASNGHGGAGGQDLFIATRTPTGWDEPQNLGPGVNGPLDDFDAAFVGSDTLVYTSGDAEKGPIALYRARLKGRKFSGRERLAAPFNCSSDFNLGPSWNRREPTILYFSANCPAIGVGRADIFSARMRN